MSSSRKQKGVRRKQLKNIASLILTGRPYSEIAPRIQKSAQSRIAVLAPSTLPPDKLKELIRKESNTEDDGDDGQIDKSYSDTLDPHEVAMVRLAGAFPDSVMSFPAFHQITNTALLSGQGRSFFLAVADAIKKAEQNKRKLGIDDVLLKMTQEWTNPDYPLWLAQEKALEQILGWQFGFQNITKAGVTKMRNRHLKCDSPYPIKNFTKRAGDKPPEFKLLKGLRIEV